MQQFCPFVYLKGWHIKSKLCKFAKHHTTLITNAEILYMHKCNVSSLYNKGTNLKLLNGIQFENMILCKISHIIKFNFKIILVIMANFIWIGIYYHILFLEFSCTFLKLNKMHIYSVLLSTQLYFINLSSFTT